MAGRTRLANSKKAGKGHGVADALGPAYAGGASNVAAAAHKRARGGRVPGKKMMARMDKKPRKANGGGVWSSAHSPAPKSES